MKYCCKDFEINARVFDRQEDGTYCISGCTQCYVATGMKFCPFCGERLSHIDLIVKSTGDGWAVWCRGARGAYFHTEEEAMKHVKMLQQS